MVNFKQTDGIFRFECDSLSEALVTANLIVDAASMAITGSDKETAVRINRSVQKLDIEIVYGKYCVILGDKDDANNTLNVIRYKKDLVREKGLSWNPL